MTYRQKDATDRWNQNADPWHQLFGENDPNRRELLDPVILQLLGDVLGMCVLDAGCGDGYLSRKLVQLGATVTGVEAADQMLSLAKAEESRDPLGITYHCGDVASLPFLADGVFDAVVTNNVIQDVENYQAAFQEFGRVLRSGGRYIHVENHPCFSLQGTGWIRDDKGNRLYRKVDYYFDRGAFLAGWPVQSGMQPTVTWHRTLGDIMNSLIGVGFQIGRVVEPEPAEAWRDNVRLNDAFRIPDFLVLVCMK